MAEVENRITLSIGGMSCASCVARVERAIRETAGVRSARVNLATEQAIVTGEVNVSDLIDAVQRTGKTAQLFERASDRRAQRAEEAARLIERKRANLVLAALLTIPVFTLEMGGHLIPAFHHWIMHTIGQQTSWGLQFLFTGAVLFGPGREFYRSGFPALFRAAPDMNSLVAVGTLAAFLFSCAALFVPHWLPEGSVHVYFEAAAVIVVLVLLGRWLEARARRQASTAIEQMIELLPNSARVVRAGKVVSVRIEDIRVGDRLELRPGERFPVDGEVVAGRGFVDESMATGESMPVGKKPGDLVIGGTLNKDGALTVLASAVGADTMLGQIVQLVEEAQENQLPIQRLVDRVTAVFVPVIFAIAALTFLLWLVLGPEEAMTLAVVNAVSVLIIACPCAMGLAAPISIVVGTGRGAQLGILFRRGDALQKLQRIGMVAFDKTGTLTEGAPKLTDLELRPGFERQAVLASIASVEAKSEHPIAQAIVEAAQEEGIEPGLASEFTNVAGFGARALVEGQKVEIGSESFMTEMGYAIDSVSMSMTRFAQEGKTPFFAAIDGQVVALIAVSDEIKASSTLAIKLLQSKGFEVALITGDNRDTAEAIAGRLGIERVIAAVSPIGKVEALRELRHAFGSTAFVGDGINDAPALADADVGVAIGTGTEIAIDAADVILRSGNPLGVADAISLSHDTLQNIRQNLFWAFAYNVALIPVAAGILYPGFGVLLSPVLAAAAMSLSSVFVVLNALRLRRWSPVVP